MALNAKLTDLLSGKKITGIAQRENILEVTFDDGSTLMAQTLTESAPFRNSGQRILKVREEPPKLCLSCEDRTTIEIVLANPGSSLAVWDKNKRVRYLG
jgi:hypothetical protein